MLWTSLFILYWLLISWGKPTTANIVSKTKAVRRFIPTPASIIFTLFLSDAAPKEPGRLSASCSPFKRTKPPRGSKLTLNTQPFFVFRLHNLGGKKIPNSSMPTPLRLAAIKCPNSCTTTSITKRNSPSINRPSDII